MTLLLAALRPALLALAASIATAQQAPPSPVTQLQIDAAIDAGAKFLLTTYAGRLSDSPLVPQERVGQSALSLYTLLKAGAPKEHATVRRLVAQVLAQPIGKTYDASCAILALSAHDAIENRRWIQELAQKLIGWQQDSGDWSYPEGGQDLSNTQFAALGLWIAARDGVPIDRTVWVKLATAVLDYQNDGGGFAYSPAVGRSSGGTRSMTAAGIGTLAICEKELRAGGHCPAKLAEKLASARARGFEWLAHNFPLSTNTNSGAWSYYALYGLERVGAQCGVKQIGGHDWYDEGAAFLIAAQTPLGAWGNGADLSDTCFAILFLKRATAVRRWRSTGEATESADSEKALRIASEGSGVVRVWIAGWNPKLARELEWKGDRGRGPRVTRVEIFADDKLCAVELGDPLRATPGESLSATHIFDSAGKHHLFLCAFVRAPGAKPGSELAFESQVLEVDVARAQPRWIDELRLEHGENLALNSRGSVKASSRLKFKDAPLGLEYDPSAVLDGNGATPWLADAKDEERTLSITFLRAPVCNVIRISPAVLPALGALYLARPIELELEINGKDKLRLAMDPDPLHPMRLELEHPTAIKRLDLRITASTASPSAPLVGIGEVEFFLEKH